MSPVSSFQVICSLVMNIICIIITIIATVFIAIELSSFHPVSYRNYGQAVSDQFYRGMLTSK